MERGNFFVLEGGEGSGKTSILNKLKKIYPNDLFVNDPNSEIESCKIIRDLLLNKKYNLEKNNELLLYTVSRSELVHKKIIPALNSGQNVWCDRFILSTLVYQGGIRKIDLSKIFSLHSYHCNNLMPDISYLCDVDAKIGLSRSRKRLEDNNIEESRWEEEGLKIHKKVNNLYLDFINFDNKHKILNSNKMSIVEMVNQIILHKTMEN